MRNVDDLCAKDTHETQHFLPFRPRPGSDSDQRHLSLNMRPSSDILHLTHARQSFALLNDLLNRPIVATRDNRDARPARNETATNGERIDIESPGAEKSDDPRQFARLVSDSYGKRMSHFTTYIL